MNENDYMNLALELAQKGCGWVNPNPMVGALLVKEGCIIGQGYHETYGAPHAERNALANCIESPHGATLYVTLEPCCHFGKTPPCTDAILQSGIRKVVVGSRDPNPLVAGNGIEQLRRNGIEVLEDVLKPDCDQLNQVFFHFIQTGLPYVVMKYAMTMDGKTATFTGASKWITGDAARHRVHEDRHRYSAIMVGVGTVLADDPLLTCRNNGGRNPVRIVCDTHLRTPLPSRIVATAKQIPTILATCCMDSRIQQPYWDAGCRILTVPQKDGHLDLTELIVRLGQEKIDSILLEGGGMLNWTALQAGIVHKVQAYIAPKLFGGATAKTPVAGMGVPLPNDAVLLTNQTITCFGNDILIESEVQQTVYRNC